MPKLAQTVTFNPNFTVTKVRLYTPDGKPTEVFGTRRDDTGDVLGAVSKDYGIVQNGDAISAVQDAFGAYGLNDFTTTSRVIRGGAQLAQTYDFKNHNITVPRVNDVLGLRLTLLNSFDGSSPLAFEVGYLRLVCLNGMKAMVRELALTKKHYGHIDLSFIKAQLSQAVQKAHDAAQLYAMMAEISLAPLEGEHIILNLAADGTISNKVALGILEIWRKPSYQADAARNLYNLYNACTQYISRNVEQERFEMARRVNATVTTTFARVTKKADDLALLMVAPPKKD